jgi:hypothetical protein
MGQKKLELLTVNDEPSRWYLLADGKYDNGTPILKIKRYRMINGKKKWERYPAKEYKGMSRDELDALLRRLNASYIVEKKQAEERYDFDHAYINKHSLERFERFLDKQANDKNHKSTILQQLNDYVFEFFVLQSKIPDPSKWHSKDDEWGDFLLTLELAPSTIKRIVGTANRFNKFLTDLVYPEMPTPRKLDPIGKAKLDKLERNRARVQGIKTRYIKDAVWEKILKHAANAEEGDPEIIPAMKLCRAFGFRISETLGLSKDKFLENEVLVDEQGDRVVDGEVTRRDVKTNARRVPYWNLTAQEAWDLVKQMPVCHPDTLTKRVNAVLSKFGHTSHDFRRTFITNSFRTAPHWKDVQRAAGHTDPRVTFGYDQDSRELSEKKAKLD